MTNSQPTNWYIFRKLCEVLGGQDRQAPGRCGEAGLLPQLFDMARRNNLLPALAVRCGGQELDGHSFGEPASDILKQALRDNILRNMQISAQALKITRSLNRAGISPLFLKGTAQLLTAEDGNLGFRKQVDIDLLVKPEQIEAAGEIFLQHDYSFYQIPNDSSAEPILLRDTSTAIKVSTGHHHLPPLAKTGYAATVELHRHFLPKRFQRNNPLEPLFNTASKHKSHGAAFLVPSAEYQVIHMVLGSFVNDSYMASRRFPIREACDYIDLMNRTAEVFDRELVEQHCSKAFAVFSGLAKELVGDTATKNTSASDNISRRLKIMQNRYNSPAVGKLLDAYARVVYLTNSLVHSPANLPAYLNRLVSA